jgi:hypothetical protein
MDKARFGYAIAGDEVDRKQYIAITTGLSGGSPFAKPSSMLGELHHPDHGQPLYVFALPDMPGQKTGLRLLSEPAQPV